MMQPLPQCGIQWLTPQEISSLDILSIEDNDCVGYFFEVDLDYPHQLHDDHNDYPLAPEATIITPDMLSSYTRNLAELLNYKPTTCKKLAPTLTSKTNYVLHSRNLRFYLEHGLILTKIHRALKFNQSCWMKPYIEFNTASRTLATTEFEKNLYKLLNNACFGKTIENVRKRRNIKVVTNQDTFLTLVAKPSFESFKLFNDNICAVELRKTSVTLDKPSYVGMAILDISKLTMYRFHYDIMRKQYKSNACLLMTDTDSLVYHVATDDLYSDMMQNLLEFDTSDYPKKHPLHSTVNKKVPGKMKDEYNAEIIEEFIGLRAKMYSIHFLDGSQKKTAKGISKVTVNKDLTHAMYKGVLVDKSSLPSIMYNIRSDSHCLFTVRITKTGLSPYDDKRYIAEDGVTTFAYGHYKILNN